MPVVVSPEIPDHKSASGDDGTEGIENHLPPPFVVGNYRDRERGLTTDELVRTAGILVFEYRTHESSDEKVPRLRAATTDDRSRGANSCFLRARIATDRLR